MEIPTIEDYRKLENKLDSALDMLSSLVKKDVKVLNTQEILLKLRVSPRSFTRRVPELTKFGLWKEGRGYLMKESDMDRYLESKSPQLN